jgi:hypothetical protein
VLEAKTQMALANRCCGIVRALRSAASAQSVSIESDIARLADTIRESWPERFSAHYVQDRIRRLASELAAEPICESTQARFVALLSDLDIFAERKLCIAAVEGVNIASDEPVAFGPFVLRRATQLELDRIHTLTVEMLGTTLYTPEQQVDIAADLARNAEILRGGVVLELEVVADAQQAHTVFVEKATKLMDLLQMSTTIAEFCRSARVGLCGNPHTGKYSAWVLPLNPGGYFQPNKLTGGIGSLCLYDGNLSLMRRAGVIRLAEALGRKATPLGSALLRAVHWYAQGVLQENGGHDTLCLVVSLEAVLSSSSGRAMVKALLFWLGPPLSDGSGYTAWFRKPMLCASPSSMREILHAAFRAKKNFVESFWSSLRRELSCAMS